MVIDIFAAVRNKLCALRCETVNDVVNSPPLTIANKYRMLSNDSEDVDSECELEDHPSFRPETLHTGSSDQQLWSSKMRRNAVLRESAL